MSNDKIEQFRKPFGALSGVLHEVESVEELTTRVADLLKKAGAKKAATAILPSEWQTAVENAAHQAGVELQQPPYAAADLPESLNDIDVGISAAAFAVAETGSLAEETVDDAYRLISALPRVHLCLLAESQLLGTLEEAVPRFRSFAENNPNGLGLTFLSGPSRTGDIEMKLILGVHGPQELQAVLVKGDNHAG